MEVTIEKSLKVKRIGKLQEQPQLANGENIKGDKL
jgi:hypothetical protein